MSLARYFFVALMLLILSGCGMFGTILVAHSVSPPDPYLRKWEKPNVTDEQRRQDSVDCGSARDVASPDSACWATGKCPPEGDRAPNFGAIKINAARRANESDGEVSSRLFNDWQRCMLGKGYRFTGECFDNEISRNQPACGAP